jgi:hypothetical protein
LKECKSIYKRAICIPNLIAALLTIAKLWNQQRCPKTDGWIKIYGVHLSIIYLSIYLCIICLSFYLSTMDYLWVIKKK